MVSTLTFLLLCAFLCRVRRLVTMPVGGASPLWMSRGSPSMVTYLAFNSRRRRSWRKMNRLKDNPGASWSPSQKRSLSPRYAGVDWERYFFSTNNVNSEVLVANKGFGVFSPFDRIHRIMFFKVGAMMRVPRSIVDSTLYVG